MGIERFYLAKHVRLSPLYITQAFSSTSIVPAAAAKIFVPRLDLISTPRVFAVEPLGIAVIFGQRDSKVVSVITLIVFGVKSGNFDGFA